MDTFASRNAYSHDLSPNHRFSYYLLRSKDISSPELLRGPTQLLPIIHNVLVIPRHADTCCKA